MRSSSSGKFAGTKSRAETSVPYMSVRESPLFGVAALRRRPLNKYYHSRGLYK